MARRAAHPLLAALRSEFGKIGDPERAAGAQAYMKSEMPCYGIAATPFRSACKRVFTPHPITTFDDWRRDVLGVWRNAKFREERHAAIELAGDRRAKAFQTMQALPMYEEMIVTGAWWDFVDTIAAHRLGDILRAEPNPMKRAMLAWSRCDNLWKRRSAILCQLGFKKETDLGFLYACVEPSLGSNEFFLRKAIGWALRQYAWTDPEEVARYVRANKQRLSNLSKREALKNVLKSGRIAKVP